MSYSSALEAAGCTVLEFEHFGSYQGEWLAVVDHQGGFGVIEGSYGSCSGCDAFEAEFGWGVCSDDDDDKERLASFGESYLPALPIDVVIMKYEKMIGEYDWGDYQEILDKLKEWKTKHGL